LEDGTIGETGTYVHGKLNGKYLKYVNQEGVRGISDVLNYKMGKLDGMQQYFTDGITLPVYKKPFDEKLYKDGNLIWSKNYVCPNKNESKRYLWRYVKYDEKNWIWQRGYTPAGKVAYSGNRINDGQYRNYIEDSLQDGKPLFSPVDQINRL
jgi:hypothetical protein